MEAIELENPDVITPSGPVLKEKEAATCSSSNQNVEKGKASPKLENTTLEESLYNAAVKGKIDTFNEHKEDLDQLLTPTKNTILHIHITARSKNGPSKKEPSHDSGKHDPSLDFMTKILQMCPALLRQVNNKDETPLHIAARHGHDDVVEFLLSKTKDTHNNDPEGVEAAKQMLKMTNKGEDTALHEAVRFNHLDVLKILIEEYPDNSYAVNCAGATPLYLAAERGHLSIISILCGLRDLRSRPRESPRRPLAAYGGPNGRTALHATVLRNDFVATLMILTKETALTQIKDKRGWNPLHYAAYYGSNLMVSLLLRCDDDSAAYRTTDYEQMTALHIAASRGQVFIMEMLISSCPDCSELVDCRGWNVLHFAMESKNPKAIELFLQNPVLSNLLNEYNDCGNTPLHQLVDLGFYMPSFISHPKVDKFAVNKKNLNALDIISGQIDVLSLEQKHLMSCLKNNDVKEGGQVEVNKDEGNMEGPGPSSCDGKGMNTESDIIANIREARNTHLVVSTLIATVTFAAGVTMPGGYKDEGSPDQGTAILTRSVAFKTFVITDTLTMMLSSSAVFLHLFMPLNKNKARIISQFMQELTLTILSMLAMVVAFITGTYAVLKPSSWLAIAVCVLGCIFFPLYWCLTSEYIVDLIGFFSVMIKRQLRAQRSDTELELEKRIEESYGLHAALVQDNQL